MRARLVIRRLLVRPLPGRQHSFVEIRHELFSTIILSLPLIQEGQLSVSGERMCTILVNRLEDYSLPSKSVFRYTERARHDPIEFCAVKPVHKQTNQTFPVSCMFVNNAQKHMLYVLTRTSQTAQNNNENNFNIPLSIVMATFFLVGISP